MEPLEPTSAKVKLWRWLLLLSVITAALGGYVWWKSRSERLEFVETIWSDSLAGHEQGSASTGQRRKIGEIWSLTRSSGFSFFGRGRSREFEGQFPVFTPANSFQRTASEKLLTQLRDAAAELTKHDWSDYWDSITTQLPSNRARFSVSCEVVFVSDQAVSLRLAVSGYAGIVYESYGLSGVNFMDRKGDFRRVQLDELFRDTDWESVISDFCLMDLQRQGTSLIGAKGDQKLRMTLLTTHLSQDVFVISPDGLRWFFPQHMLEPNSGREFEVLIPFEKLAEHLRPDGPHRLFQKNVNE